MALGRDDREGSLRRASAASRETSRRAEAASRFVATRLNTKPRRTIMTTKKQRGSKGHVFPKTAKKKPIGIIGNPDVTTGWMPPRRSFAQEAMLQMLAIERLKAEARNTRALEDHARAL